MRFLISGAVGLADSDARAAGYDGLEPAGVAGWIDQDPSAIRAAIERAHELGAAWVGVWDLSPGRGSLGSAVARFVRAARLPADAARAAGLSLLVENRGRFRLAREMWSALESLAHPAVACVWDYALALAAGELPVVSVPTLNSRIRAVVIHAARVDVDAKIIEVLLARLRGIGFEGDAIVRFDGSATIEHAAAVLKRIKSIGGLEPPPPAPAKTGEPKVAVKK